MTEKNMNAWPDAKRKHTVSDDIIAIFDRDNVMYPVVKTLLKDRTTKKNIVWATDLYKLYGNGYFPEDSQMTDWAVEDLMSCGVMLPRVLRTNEEKLYRTKKKAEVFTPSWVCSLMNSYCDDDWFGRKNTIVIDHKDHSWEPVPGKVQFDDADTTGKLLPWQQYLKLKKIEITCGEAPFIVSRYDASTGEAIPVRRRIGFLDRKLRVVTENALGKADWLYWAEEAFKASYGYEFSGDNLFFARVNLVQTFIDYFEESFGEEPDVTDVRLIAKVVSWNLWQMDGLKDTVPYGVPSDAPKRRKKSGIAGQTEMQFAEERGDREEKQDVYAKVKDWDTGKTMEFREVKENG